MATTLDTLVVRSGITLNDNVSVKSLLNASILQSLLQSRLSTDTQLKFSMDVGGAMGWGDGSSAGDVWLYRNAPNSLALSNTNRSGLTGITLNVGTLSAATSLLVNATSTGATATIGGSLNVGSSSIPNGNNNVVIGTTHTINSGANKCLVSGNGNSIAGTSNAAIGDAVSVTSTGSKNVGLVSAKITGTSNYCGVIGDATISGAATSCFAIGASGGSIAGKSGSVIIGDNNSAGTFSPGGNNMLQMRFNGGGTGGAACYWFSTDVNTNGVKLLYQDNAWAALGSDARLKNKVSEVDCSGVLNAFEKVPIYRYTYKHDKDGGCDKTGCILPPRLRTGFFANEYNAAFGAFVEPQFSPDHPYHKENPEDPDPIQTFSYGDLSFMNFCGVRGLLERVKRLEAGGGGSVADSSRLVDRVERLERNAETVQLFKPVATANNEEVMALQKKVDVLTKTLQAILKNPKMLLNSPELLKYVESNGEVGLDDGFTAL